LNDKEITVMLTASEDLTLSTLDVVKYNPEINCSKEKNQS